MDKVQSENTSIEKMFGHLFTYVRIHVSSLLALEFLYAYVQLVSIFDIDNTIII